MQRGKPTQPNAPAIKSGESAILGTGNLPKIIKVADGQQQTTVESPAVKADFAFNAIAPNFKEAPGDAGFADHRHVAIRTSTDGRTWSEWEDIHTDGKVRENDPHPDRQFPETPLFAEGRYFQFKVTVERPAPTAKASEISDLKVTYIDSRESGAQKISRVMQKAFTPERAMADSPQGPNVVSRAQWGSPDPYGTAFRGTDLEWFPQYVPVTQAFIHHTVNSNYSSDFNSVVRGIWQFQTYTRGWGDIGYNYLVDSNGTIYEGRFGGENVVGGHVLGYNRGSIGVALIGCFQSGGECRSFNGGDVGPAWPMLDSLYNLLGYKLKGAEVDPMGSHTFCGNQDVGNACKNLMNIAGHRDGGDTSCPGNLTYDQLGSIRGGVNSRKLNLFPYAAKQLTYGTIDATDGQKQITLQFKNTGSTAWSRSSPRFFLKTANPDDRASPYQGNDWVTSQHAALLNEASVAPGQVGSFTFNINGSNVPLNSYSYEGFRLVVEGVTELKNIYTVPIDAPSLQWSVVSLNYGSGSSLMAPNEEQTMTLTVKNTGSATWNNSSTPLRLATWWYDRQSPFQHSEWVSPTRAATMQQSSVAPGQNATFSFKVKAPGREGEFGEAFNLVADNRGWGDYNGFSIYYRVANPYQWQPVSLSHSSGTAQMNAGDTQAITIIAKNTGSATWTKSGSFPVRLGTAAPVNRGSAAEHSSWLNAIRPAALQETSVAPGQNGTFTFTVKANRTGEYFERVNLVAEGLTWFNDPGLQFYLNAPGYYAWRPMSLSYSPQNSTLPAGSTVTLTLKAQNIGNATWKNDGEFPLRLATVAPLNRGSIYEHSSWMNSIRPTGLQEASVPPGGTGTFVFAARVPNTPGQEYRERFSLVAENLMWLNDPGFSVYIRSY